MGEVFVPVAGPGIIEEAYSGERTDIFAHLHRRETPSALPTGSAADTAVFDLSTHTYDPRSPAIFPPKPEEREAR